MSREALRDSLVSPKKILANSTNSSGAQRSSLLPISLSNAYTDVSDWKQECCEKTPSGCLLFFKNII